MSKDDGHKRGRERLEKALNLDKTNIDKMNNAERQQILDRLYRERDHGDSRESGK